MCAQGGKKERDTVLRKGKRACRNGDRKARLAETVAQG